MSKKYTIMLAVFFLICLTGHIASASASESLEYKIQGEMSKLFPTPESKDTNHYAQFEQSVKTIISNTSGIRIQTDSDLLEYGPLTPSNPVKRSLKVAFWGNGKVYIWEDHALTSTESAIPDTRCDNGGCDTKHAEVWINPLTYGFGVSFDDKVYTQVPNYENKQSPTPIDTSLPLLFKVNISSSQKNDLYTNTLTFLGVSL